MLRFNALICFIGVLKTVYLFSVFFLFILYFFSFSDLRFKRFYEGRNFFSFFFGRDKYTFYSYLYCMYQVLNMYCINEEAGTKFNHCGTQISTSIFNRQLPNMLYAMNLYNILNRISGCYIVFLISLFFIIYVREKDTVYRICFNILFYWSNVLPLFTLLKLSELLHRMLAKIVEFGCKIDYVISDMFIKKSAPRQVEISRQDTYIVVRIWDSVYSTYFVNRKQCTN